MKMISFKSGIINYTKIDILTPNHKYRMSADDYVCYEANASVATIKLSNIMIYDVPTDMFELTEEAKND